jgi:hypothetical protein
VGKKVRDDLVSRIKELGVERVAELTSRTVRSVKRWMTGKVKPRADAAARLQQASDEFRRTRGWRRQQMPPSREKRLKSKGGQIHMNGMCGPENDSPGASIRERRFTVELTPEAMAAVLDAWLQGGEPAARRVLDDVLYWEYIRERQYNPGTEEPNWGFRTEALYGLEVNHFHDS